MIDHSVKRSLLPHFNSVNHDSRISSRAGISLSVRLQLQSPYRFPTGRGPAVTVTVIMIAASQLGAQIGNSAALTDESI
jgi:hypothetical protein